MSGSVERWQRLDLAFASAVAAPVTGRDALLAAACGSDQGLRREVELLLQADAGAGDFLELSPSRLWLERTATNADARPGGADPELLEAGRTLAGRYRIEGLVGRGGMGAVYRACDESLHTQVAVKVLSRRLTQDPVRREAFRSEVRLARLVSHPAVCRVHDIGEDGETVFLTMEYVAGESLAERLRRGGRPQPAWCLRVLRDVARGLAAAHAVGVVHRDLKPENVLLRAGSDEAVVVDFGIAARTVEERERCAWIAGTPGYMSPEQLAGQPVDARSDVYVLGILAHRLATGRIPDVLDDVGPGLVSLHPALARLIAGCLRFDPAERPRDASAALGLLAGTSGASDGRRPRWTAASRAGSGRAERRTALWRPGLAALVSLALGGLGWQLGAPPRQAGPQPAASALGRVSTDLSLAADGADTDDDASGFRFTIRSDRPPSEGWLADEPPPEPVGSSRVGIHGRSLESHGKALERAGRRLERLARLSESLPLGLLASSDGEP